MAMPNVVTKVTTGDVAITDIPSAFLMQEICVRHTVSNVSPCQAYTFGVSKKCIECVKPVGKLVRL